MRCLTEKETVALLSGFLAKEEAAAAAVHMERCEPCAKRLRELTDIRDAVGARPGEFEDTALCGEIMTLVELGRGEADRLPRMRRTSPWTMGKTIAAAAAAVALAVTTAAIVFRSADLSNKDAILETSIPEFAARGGAPSTDQWVSLTLFERRDTAEKSLYRPVLESVPKDAALAAAYEDRSTPPFRYLMVFAVDPRGEVFWYYPEHDKDGDDRFSIETSKKKGETALPDEVTHALSLGPLRFFGIFSKSPLRAREVEATVRRQLEKSPNLSQLERIDIGGTAQWTRQVRVVSEAK